MRVAVHKIFLVDDNLLQGRMLRVHAFVQDSDSNTSLPLGNRPGRLGGNVRAGLARVPGILVVPIGLSARGRGFGFEQDANEIGMCGPNATSFHRFAGGLHCPLNPSLVAFFRAEQNFFFRSFPDHLQPKLLFQTS